MTLHSFKARLKPFNDRQLYVYDDPARGVYDEPLMDAATDIIACVMMSVGFGDLEQMHPECTLYFTDTQSELRADLPSLQLYNPQPDAGGTIYCVWGLYPEQTVDKLDDWLNIWGGENPWLCEHLLDYFSQPPQTLGVSVQPSGWQPDALTAPAAEE